MIQKTSRMRDAVSPGRASLNTLRAVGEGNPLELAQGWQEAVKASHACLASALTSGAPLYGVNTGFGKLASTRISESDLATLQRNLIRPGCLFEQNLHIVPKRNIKRVLKQGRPAGPNHGFGRLILTPYRKLGCFVRRERQLVHPTQGGAQRRSESSAVVISSQIIQI
jgi:hypothetical protein